MALQSNNCNKYAAVIVLYKPELELLSRNISQVLKTSISSIILIDNSPNELDNSFLLSFNSKIINYVYNNGNKGIAYGLNAGLKIADSLGYNWVLQLDQDSIIPMDMINIYDLFLSKNKDNVGMLCPQLLQGVDRKTGDATCISKVLFAITSGSLININAWNDIGRYDEKLFIDGVDHDICIRLWLNNYPIIQFDQLYLNHRLGIIKRKKIMGRNITVCVGHSPFRFYYMVRNYNYLKKKYYTTLINNPMFNPHFWRLRDKYRTILIFEKNKIQYLISILLGYYYYKNNKFINFDDIIYNNKLLKLLFH